VVVIVLFAYMYWFFSSESNYVKRKSLIDIEYGYEPFYSNCESCDDKPFGRCLQCVNCGFISKDGYGKCVPGDMYGPTDFDINYVNGTWHYNDDYWNNVLTSDEISVPSTYVNDKRFPYYKIWEHKYDTKENRLKLLDQSGWKYVDDSNII